MSGDHASHAPHATGSDPTNRARTRALWISLGANGGFMVVEIVGGFAFGSLALLADAAHMATDVVGLAIALVAQALVMRPASARHTYGLQRAEVLGALANGVVLIATACWIAFEAVGRIGSPQPVDGAGVIVVATLGLGVNLVSVALLRRSQGASLNLQGATLHMLLDAAGSVGAIVAGIAVVVADADWVDPFVSILVSALVVWSAWSLLRDTIRVLLEGTPRGLDVDALERALVAEPGVEAVHHLHVWDLASDTPALSAHVVLHGEPSLHEAQLRGDALKAMLEDAYGIGHATLELECHDCAAPDGLHRR